MSNSYTILFTGDLCANGIFDQSLKDGNNIFSPQLRSLISSSDIVIYNLEGPLLEKSRSFIPRNTQKTNINNSDKLVSFVPKAKYTCFNLANNHLMDYGIEGLQSTKKQLQENSFLYFGAGNNSSEAIRPIVLNLASRKIWLFSFSIETGDSASNSLEGISSNHHIKQIIKAIKNVPKNDLVFLSVHIGEEYTLLPSPEKRSLFKKIARQCRVDAIICHHSHTPQGIEYVGNTIILYSLGNFIFDLDQHKLYPYTNKGIIASFEITEKGIFPKIFFTKCNPKNRNIDILPSNPIKLYKTLTDFSNYKTNWRKESFRVLFQRKNEPKTNTPQLKSQSPIQWVFRKTFYKKLAIILFDPFYRSIYFNAVVLKYLSGKK